MVKLFDKFLDFGFIAIVKLFGISPSCEIVPTCTARSFRVRGDDADAIFYEVIPILDFFRVALANKEYNGRCIGGAVVWKFLDPSFVDDADESFEDDDILVIPEDDSDENISMFTDDDLKYSRKSASRPRPVGVSSVSAATASPSSKAGPQ